MSLTTIPKINPNEFSEYEERKETPDRGNNRGPAQKIDAAIKESVYRAFWKDNFLRTIEYYEVDVHVKDRIVRLDGHIVSVTSQNLIEKAIEGIPGVNGIENNLVLDDKLTIEVAVSLGKLEHLYGCKFFTGVSHGVVSLHGIVSKTEVKLLAEQCAAANPNVRAVINNVRVLGEREALREQHFQQPVIGESVYFLDGLSGFLKQVVINPNNRCVVALIIKGRFAYRSKNLDSRSTQETLPRGQVLIVPMMAVRYLTRASGFLDIHSNEKSRYTEFDPAYFVAPAKDWKPPYPYCLEDILFIANRRKTENQVLQQLAQSQFAAMLEDAQLKEQLLANDSLGG